jgi:hypothetical protein
MSGARTARTGLTTAALLVAAVLFAPVRASAEITAGTRWADPSRVDLDVEFPGEGYHANWELFRCACGDLLVHSELSAPDAVDKGETLLLQGRAVLSRGFGEHQEELGSSLDAPALMMQLALRLLERAEPGGPAAIAGPVDVDVVDEINQIYLESYSAIGGFHAPWSVKGTIAPAGADQRRFDLRFEFTVGAGSAAQQGAMRLKGLADFSADDFPVSRSARLEEWTINWRDEQDPAIPAAAEARTLDELRAAMRENNP